MAKSDPNPQQRETRLKAYDEANVARLGLISIHERIPEDFTRWEVNFIVDGRPSRLTCVASKEYGGVPHGLDGDIATAIMDLYIEAGAPEDGTVSTTAYRLLKRAGLSDKGHYYKALRESLFRLRSALYTASEAWMDRSRRKWTTVTFNYLEAFNFIESDGTEFVRGSELVVKLSDVIVRSIRASHLKPLDLEFLISLTRPLTRALYRLLDGKRYDPEGLDFGVPLDVYSRNLVEWGQECKIVDQAPDRIRRTLSAAHEELIARGYLRDVGFVGRGKSQTINYLFAAANAQADPAILGELLRRGMSRPVGLELVRALGEAHVADRVRKYEAILKSGFNPRNRVALLVDVIRDAETKYADPPGFKSAAQLTTTLASRHAQVELERDVDRQAELQAEREYVALPKSRQVDLTIEALSFFIKRDGLHAQDVERLRSRLIIQLADPREFKSRVLSLYRVGKDAEALQLLRGKSV